MVYLFILSLKVDKSDYLSTCLLFYSLLNFWIFASLRDDTESYFHLRSLSIYLYICGHLYVFYSEVLCCILLPLRVGSGSWLCIVTFWIATPRKC